MVRAWTNKSPILQYAKAPVLALSSFYICSLLRGSWSIPKTRHAGHERLTSLPPYSPGLNPIEQVWRILRRERTRNRFFRALSDLAEAVDVSLCRRACAQRAVAAALQLRVRLFYAFTITAKFNIPLTKHKRHVMLFSAMRKGNRSYPPLAEGWVRARD